MGNMSEYAKMQGFVEMTPDGRCNHLCKDKTKCRHFWYGRRTLLGNVCHTLTRSQLQRGP